MAQRRMFSKNITNSSQFLMMPQSTQNLYFHLGMNADDDGFCEHFTIMRMTDSKPDDLKVLQAKGFVSVFDDRVLVITDWKENNYLRSDRYTPSKYLQIYKEELALLSRVNVMDTNGIPVVDKMATQDRIGKDRIGKDINTGDETSPSTPSSLKDLKVKVVSFSETDLELATLLRDKILANTPTFKQPNLPMWAKEVRLMRERDNRTEEQIRYMINWCQKDHFWQANILSTRKLRDKFDTLVAQVKRGKTADKAKVGTVLL